MPVPRVGAARGTSSGGRADPLPPPPIALWSMPRSGSTAFERMMTERGDHTVFSEPFSHAYYDGPEQRSQRFDVTMPDATVATIASTIAADAARGPVFVKDMACHVVARADAAFLAPFTNTFLIRDPAWSIPSLAAHWPDFTEEEVGIDAVAQLVRVVESLERAVVIVDNDDLRGDPVGTVRAWCAAVAIPFVADALAWSPGLVAGWERWADWHEATSESSGFLPPETRPPPAVEDPRIAAAIATATPVYEDLRQRRLRPIAGETGSARPPEEAPPAAPTSGAGRASRPRPRRAYG